MLCDLFIQKSAAAEKTTEIVVAIKNSSLLQHRCWLMKLAWGGGGRQFQLQLEG
jgi:hypothetical protein